MRALLVLALTSLTACAAPSPVESEPPVRLWVRVTAVDQRSDVWLDGKREQFVEIATWWVSGAGDPTARAPDPTIQLMATPRVITSTDQWATVFVGVNMPLATAEIDAPPSLDPATSGFLLKTRCVGLADGTFRLDLRAYRVRQGELLGRIERGIATTGDGHDTACLEFTP